MSSLLGPEYVEGVAASLVREYLGRKGLLDTLEALEREAPAKNHQIGNISNRNGLLKVLHFGKQMQRNKSKERPYRAMIEIMCQYFMDKGEKTQNLATSTSSSEEHLRQCNSNTNSLKRTKKNKDKKSATAYQNDLVEEDIDGGETFLGGGRAGLFDKDEIEDMAMNYTGSNKAAPPSSRGARGMSGPITSNMDDRDRDRQRKMMKGRPLSSRRTEESVVSRREEPSVVIKPKETTSINAKASKDMRAMRPDVLDTFNMLKARPDYKNGGFRSKMNDAGPLTDVFSSEPKRPLSGARGRLSSRDDEDPYADYRYDVTKSSIGSDRAIRPPTTTGSAGSSSAAKKDSGKSLMDILGTGSGSGKSRASSSSEPPPKDPSNEDSGGEDKRLGDMEVGELDDVEDDLADLDITKPVQQAVLAVDSRPIDVPTASSLKNLIFGSAMALFNNEWRYQSFSFCDLPKLRYGIVQKKGGSCGVLASVQAYVLKHLIYNNPPNANLKGMDPSRQVRSEALALSLAHIFWKAGGGKSAVVTLPGIKGHYTASKKIKTDGLTETLSINTLSSLSDLQQFIKQNISQFEVDGTGGVILALYSAILSRSVEGVIEDMDEPTNTLMGAHGYCTQDMVNLFLTGKAASNVFNDVIELDSGTGEVTKLKGISGRSDIGLMSLFEHYKSCEVGTYMKTPRYPIWVVCSESHFSVLFSLKSKLLNDWKAERKFDLFYYDELAKQDQEIRLTIDTTNRDFQVPSDEELVPPLDHCIRTKWPGAEVNWNDTEPLL